MSETGPPAADEPAVPPSPSQNAGGRAQDPSGTDPSERLQQGTITPLWLAILAIYALLFISSGYVAFFTADWNPALESYWPNITEGLDNLNQEKQDAYIDFFISGLEKHSEIFEKQRDLAAQSFNVVLGALLGFLSASAAIVVGRQRRPGAGGPPK